MSGPAYWYEDNTLSRVARSRIKKERRRQIRQYHSERREGMVLRGHLQAVGLLDYILPSTVRNEESAAASLRWIASYGGISEGDTEALLSILQSALNRYQDIVGLPRTALPEGFEV